LCQVDTYETLGHSVKFNPTKIEKADVVVFQKRADLVTLMRRYRQHGTRVVLDVSDYGRYPAQHADITVVGTKQLTTLYPCAIIVPDVLDINDSVTPRTTHNDDLLKIVWFGTPENTMQAGPVATACNRLGLSLHMISNHTRRYAVRIPGTVRLPWSLATIDSLLVRYDLAACPFILEGCQGFKSFRSKAYLACKSGNRPLKAWALGLPVIGSPIPSYIDCGVVHLATSVDEWTEKLIELRSRTLRAEDAARGATLIAPYRTEVVAQQWLKVFTDHADDSGSAGC
jgi:hypothetical protein